MNLEKIRGKLARFKYPLLILLLGLLFLLIPSGRKEETAEESEDLRLQQTLCEAKGVGETRVLISDHGVLVVCEGGDDASVKLDILRAVGSYTGFGSDKITILRLENQEWGRSKP